MVSVELLFRVQTVLLDVIVHGALPPTGMALIFTIQSVRYKNKPLSWEYNFLGLARKNTVPFYSLSMLANSKECRSGLELNECFLMSRKFLLFDIYSVSLRNGEVQSLAAIISHQDSGRQIKRVLPGPVNHSGYNSRQTRLERDWAIVGNFWYTWATNKIQTLYKWTTGLKNYKRKLCGLLTSFYSYNNSVTCKS